MAGVICDLLNLFDDEMYAHLIGWFYKLSRNTKVSRTLTVYSSHLNWPFNLHTKYFVDQSVFKFKIEDS